MKLLLVLNGESYRSGSQMTRVRGTKNYIERQMLACNSHIKLINEIKNKYNIETDIIIHTYRLNENDDNNLINFYKNHNINVISVNFLHSVCKNECDFLNLTYDKINEHLLKYDFCLLVRIDLYLKEFFIKNIIFDNKIRFPHLDSNTNIEISNQNGEFLVCHAIIYYPKKYFLVIQNRIVYNSTHSIYNNLVKFGINHKEIDFFVETLHICSTDIASNPIYCQVGRKYKINFNYDGVNNVYYLYDKHLNKLILNKELVLLKWDQYNNNNTENLLLSNVCY
jgi:hypothetical protein